MKAAGNFVGFVIEFSAGVKNGHDHFGSGLFFRGVHVHRDAATVVNDCDAVVVVNDDVDFVAVAGHGFVDRVIHHFPNEVVQTLLGGRANVHCGALAHRLEVAQNFDGGGVVPMARGFAGHRLFLTHIVRLLTNSGGEGCSGTVFSRLNMQSWFRFANQRRFCSIPSGFP